PGVYAFSRVDAEEKTEYLVALNNATSPQSVDLTTLTSDAGFTTLYGEAEPFTTDQSAAAAITVPALSAVVWKAGQPVSAPEEAAPLTLTVPAAGAGVTGQATVQADGADQW